MFIRTIDAFYKSYRSLYKVQLNSNLDMYSLYYNIVVIALIWDIGRLIRPKAIRPDPTVNPTRPDPKLDRIGSGRHFFEQQWIGSDRVDLFFAWFGSDRIGSTFFASMDRLRSTFQPNFVPIFKLNFTLISTL